MPEEKDGQSQKGQPVAEKKPTFDELYSKGWDEIDEVEAVAPAQEQKTPSQQLKEKEPECPDCPGGKPFKVIKHGGKDVIIKTEKEYNDLVQMGFDYTKKTQALAEERRKLEAERETGKTEHQKLLERLERLEKGSAAGQVGDNGKAKPAVEQAEVKPEDEEAKIFGEYGLDPEYASDFEKKLVKDVALMKRETQGAKELTQVIILKEMTKNITNALADAVKEYPVEDITDEKGESVTGQQVILSFKEIVANPANQKTPVGELAKMAVKRVYDSQQLMKGGTTVSEEMTVEEFAQKNPGLYAKILKAGGHEAVADFVENQEGLPPSITPRKASVPSSDQKGKPRFKGLSEAIDAGMDDPDLKALFGG